MAAATLSLFPNPSLKNKSGQIGSLRYGVRPAKEPDFEMVKMSDSTQGIVIAIQETPVPSPSKKAIEEPRAPNHTLEQPSLPSIVLSTPPKARSITSQASSNVRPRTPSTPAKVQITSKSRSPLNSPTRSRVPSPLQLEGSPQSHVSSPTLVRKGSNASTRTATHSPVMRSMFPRYDPSVSLNRQQYFPSAQSGRASSDASRPMYSASLYSQPNRQTSRPTAPALVIPSSTAGTPILQQMPSGPTTLKFSSPDELLQLWSIANGQDVDSSEDVFQVELGCDSLSHTSETISFSSSSQILYKLSASSNLLIISRTHPLHPTPTIQICETTISRPAVTSPLVTTIFPKLAELMAVDQSSSIAVTHRLDRQASDELQIEAIDRARQNEASNLLWDSDSGRYYLIHPTLLDNTSTTFPIEITPSALNPEQIVISAPETNGATPLLSLSLSTRTLKIHPGPITALPSMYTLDTLMTALLTLLLHLHRASSKPTLPGTITQNPDTVPPTFPPPPTLLTHASRPARAKKRTLSTWSKGVFSSSATRQKSPDLETGQPTHALNSSTETGIVTKARPEKLDSDHDWTFQPLVNANDETLPAATRTLVRTLYWGFQVLVWMLGVGVNLMAAGIAGTGRLVKKA